jgi:hypothetical protein
VDKNNSKIKNFKPLSPKENISFFQLEVRKFFELKNNTESDKIIRLKLTFGRLI